MSVMRETDGPDGTKQTKRTKAKPAPRGRLWVGALKDPTWRPALLEALREDPNISYACEKVGISRNAAYRQRERSAVFRNQWDNAIKTGCGRGWHTMRKFGTEGVPTEEYLLVETTIEERTRYENDKVTGKVVAVPYTVRRNRYEKVEKRSPSVRALEVALRQHDPDFKENAQTQIVNQPGTAIAVKVETNVERLPDAELHRIIAQAAQAGALSKEALARFAVAAPHLLADAETGNGGNGADHGGAAA